MTFKQHGIASLRKTFRNILDSEEQCSLFNVFAFEPNEKGSKNMVQLRGIVNYMAPERATDRPMWIVSLVHIVSGKSISEVVIGGYDDEENFSNLVKLVWDMITSLMFQVAEMLENYTAVYVTTDAVKWFKGIGFYITLAEKIKGKKMDDTELPSYTKNDIVELATRLLYLESEEGVTKLEERIDDYLDMKKLIED